ncbi:MAG: hypothetical protein ACOC1D_01110 [Prolixibacteraceae bacterium]
MRRIQILTLVLVFLAGTAGAQILRYRVTANSGLMIKETGQGEIINPQSGLDDYPSATDFSPSVKIGADIEIMAPITDYFELGVEFDYSNLAGRTETARLYNFFLFDWVNPMPDNYIYPAEPVIYETTQLSFLGTTRIYFLPPRSRLNLFLKAFGGIAFVGSEFKFHDPYYRIEYRVGDALYAQGTKSSQKPKDRAFTGGGGFGGQYKLSGKMAVYLEANVSYVGSDIVNGVPDFNYIGGTGVNYKRAEGIGALTGQISLGLVYSAIPDQRLNRGNYTNSRRATKPKNWKRKRSNPFKKR